MVLAARRAYSDLIRWMKDARPRSLRPWRLAVSLFRSFMLGALILLGVIGLLSPSRYGSPTSRATGSAGWWVLLLLVTCCLLWIATKRHGIRRSVERMAEPFSAPLSHVPAFEPAWSALDSCPAPLRTRFAAGWVWAPVAMLVAGAVFAAAAAYFIVDTLLAELAIGPEQPLLFLINATLGLVVLRLGAKRISTLRLALSVHRAVNGRYV
ncbi:MAG: hypothetical protein M3N53_14960 [Actinomycetota bacterium]|nr:hypothetical protein [Actinomycetota bacterium]